RRVRPPGRTAGPRGRPMPPRRATRSQPPAPRPPAAAPGGVAPRPPLPGPPPGDRGRREAKAAGRAATYPDRSRWSTRRDRRPHGSGPAYRPSGGGGASLGRSYRPVRPSKECVVVSETLANLLHESRRFAPPADLAADANVT